MPQYDVAVIGAGPGGYVAAIRAGQLGLKVVCIEKDERLGGTCLLRGCIPTKAMLHSAEVLETAREAKEHGIDVKGEISVDMAGVLKRKEKMVSSNAKGVEFLFRKNKVERVHGHARLAGPGRINVAGASGNQVVEAKHVVLASGSAPRLLPGLKVDGNHIVTSDELLENKTVPKRLIVLGAGAVGVEFASVFRRFGSEVTVVEMLPRLVPLEDEDVSAEFEKGFRRRGIKALTSAKLEKVDRTETGVKATITTAKGTQELEAEMFLCAIGRRPVTENLDLEKLPNVKVERGFVVVDPKTMSTGEPWLSAIGDIVAVPGHAHPQLAHLASAEGIFVMERLAGLKPHPVNLDLVPGATYSDPEVASIGLTEREAKERGYKVKTGVFPFAANSKAKILGASEGMVKVVGEEKYDEVLGVHIVGPRATELIADAASLLRLEATSEEMLHVIRPHPTLSEAVTEAAHAVRGKPIHV
ncbi:MAG TPA: dihydrolipoyl dehydrogenase [Myxococcales bacterium]|nr:dihydrolipoyl dehydrogenase [Myxococcales bacterium]